MKIGVEEIRRVPREIYERHSVWVEPTGMTRDSQNPLLGSRGVVTVAFYWPPDPERERAALDALQPYFPGMTLVGHHIWFSGLDDWLRGMLDRTYEVREEKPSRRDSGRRCAFCEADGTTSDLFGARSAFVCATCVEAMVPCPLRDGPAPCSFCSGVAESGVVSSHGPDVVCARCIHVMQDVRGGLL